MNLNLDEYQKDVLATQGHMVLCSGRQVGKSTIVSIKAGEEAVHNSRFSVLIISATERQAEELFTKTLYYLQDNYKGYIKKGKQKPTKHVIHLTNGSIIRCLPTGLAGTGIRGFTINLLIADEAAFINEEVWQAVTPMLLTTGGSIWLLSTPHGRSGYFYERYSDPTFKVFHVNSEEVISSRPLSDTWSEHQRKSAIEHLEREKKSMSERQYAQEYMGMFVDELAQFFPDDLIKRSMTMKRLTSIGSDKRYYLGVDIARLGNDYTVFVVLEKINDNMEMRECVMLAKKRLNESTNEILLLDKRYNFKQIFIDDGGIGVGVFDYLLEHTQTKKKVIALNNRARPLDRDMEHKKKILKEDLYNHLLMLMQQGRIKFLDDDEIFIHFKSIQYEYVTKPNALTKFRIFSASNKDGHGDIVEATTRAAWGMKDKRLPLIFA